MDVHRLYSFILPLFRRRRLRMFLSLVKPTGSTTILDVGGYPWFWSEVSVPLRITLINTHFPPGLKSLELRSLVKGDGRIQPFRSQSFEVVFSNSVIEHLFTFENQARFAEELRRVGCRLWVQTPARSFFFEPHLLTPFIHFFPRSWQQRLLRWGTIWGLITKPSREQVAAFLEEVRLLSFKEMQSLFPDCRIYKEKFCFMTKSFIAVR